MRLRTPLYLAIATLLAVSAVPALSAAQSSDSADEPSASSSNDEGDSSDNEEGDSSENDEGDSSEDENGSSDGDESEDGEERESEHGSYEWRLSYGGGVQYGLFFTPLERWNTHLLEPNNAGEFSTASLSSIALAAEASFLEGSRLTVFGGIETPFTSDPSILAAYGGVEPAFAFRRNSWELALGLGVGVGNVSVTTGDDRTYSSGLVILRPTIEVRRYFNERFAAYARFGFNQWLPFGGNSDDLSVERSTQQVSSDALLQEGGVYAALGARFGMYPEHEKVVPDSDGDGLRDDVDDCKNEQEDEDGFEDDDGCPENDNDDDGVSDDQDECSSQKEDEDGFEDDDGCPDPDNDGDDISDEEDECSDQPEDEDGFEDDDGCPDPDNDGDDISDEEDECPGEVGIPSNNGCPSDTVQIEENRLVVDAAIEFEAPEADEETDEEKPPTKLTSDSEEALQTVAEVLSVHPKLAKINIRVHTADGDEEEQKNIAEKRAEAVRTYLVDAGVDANRLATEAVGIAEPMKPEDADEKKPVARVEFLIEESGTSGGGESSGENGDDSGSGGDDGDSGSDDGDGETESEDSSEEE